ncbi:putative MetA-pathway of phenol degradation [Methylocella tundrae]|uniref:Putative MetA-pathway of phenol degradation n=2 Tax=Methylocella tundrae TaxID=227605 RepID=A0A4U8Z157_METTU|nr:putative MetA-pathway of phenol degradation [Methylocella tundrae]
MRLRPNASRLSAALWRENIAQSRFRAGRVGPIELAAPLCAIKCMVLSSKTRLLLGCSVGLLVSLLGAQPARADDSAPAPDKSAYSLFNPTPTDAMRAFEPERPAKILNPFTVDAGHFQIESDFLSYTHANVAGAGTTQFETTDPTIKLGLTSSIDLELDFYGYLTSATHSNQTGGLIANGHGFGDTIIKTKINLVGNDGGDFAMALVPFVKAPSAAPGLGNGVVEGGVALPMQINLPSDFVLALQTEYDVLKNANDSQRYANLVNIANLSHSLSFISKDLSASVEFFSAVGTDPFTPAEYTLDLGLAYLIRPNVQLDAGANFGLTRASPGLNLYTGVTTRF